MRRNTGEVAAAPGALPFIPGSRGEEREGGGAGTTAARGAPRGGGRAASPPPAPISQQTSLLRLSFPEAPGQSRAAAPRRAPRVQAGPGAGGAHSRPAGCRGGFARGGERGRAAALKLEPGGDLPRRKPASAFGRRHAGVL